MNNKDFSDFGQEMQETIKLFFDSQEFKDLQENIRTTVGITMKEMQRSARDAADFLNRNAEGWWEMPPGKPASDECRDPVDIPQEKVKHKFIWPKVHPFPVIKKPPESKIGTLLSLAGIFGAIAAWTVVLAGLEITFLKTDIITGAFYGIFGDAFAEQLISFLSSLGMASFGLTAVFAAACMAAAYTGSVMKRRAGRFKLYMKTIGKKEYGLVEELAQAIGRSEKYVIKDLKRMMRRRWFKEGHFDEQNVYFILTDETYQMYLDSQAELKRRREAAEKQKKEQEMLDQDPVKKQLKITVEEGKEYIRRIRSINEKIPGEEISGKLNRLEAVCTRIFEYVEENPDQLSDIRKFMNYYLPTTLKLVETYYEFSTQPVRGENITTAQNEIEDMLDNINLAFEKMFDKLFEQSAMDISTDITVLSTMLTQEGLLEHEFK